MDDKSCFWKIYMPNSHYRMKLLNNIQSSKEPEVWLSGKLKVKPWRVMACHSIFQGMTILYTLKMINHIIIYQIYQAFRCNARILGNFLFDPKNKLCCIFVHTPCVLGAYTCRSFLRRSRAHVSTLGVLICTQGLIGRWANPNF